MIQIIQTANPTFKPTNSPTKSPANPSAAQAKPLKNGGNNKNGDAVPDLNAQQRGMLNYKLIIHH